MIDTGIESGCEDLLAQLVGQAVRDATNKRLPAAERDDAVQWLRSPGLVWALAVMGVADVDAMMGRIHDVVGGDMHEGNARRHELAVQLFRRIEGLKGLCRELAEVDEANSYEGIPTALADAVEQFIDKHISISAKGV